MLAANNEVKYAIIRMKTKMRQVTSCYDYTSGELIYFYFP